MAVGDPEVLTRADRFVSSLFGSRCRSRIDSGVRGPHRSRRKVLWLPVCESSSRPCSRKQCRPARSCVHRAQPLLPLVCIRSRAEIASGRSYRVWAPLGPGHRPQALSSLPNERIGGLYVLAPTTERARASMPPVRIATSFAEAQEFGLPLSSTPTGKGGPSIARGQVRTASPSPRAIALWS